MLSMLFNPYRRSFAVLALAGLASSSLCAQALNPSRPDWLVPTQRWLDAAVATALPPGTSPLRTEIELGELDSRLRLAPCAKVEPFLPPGARLWGKTRLGLRCVEGPSRWTVFLPLTVKAFGPAWVVRGDIASGTVLTESDALQAEVDWALEPSAVVVTPEQWVGQVAARALSTGQVLRQAAVRPAQVFLAGAQIRVVAQGQGFQVTTDGLALSAGVIGQQARVRMDNGRIMSGLVTDRRTVTMEL
jgi:flagella basal body P-ring formation protein FlgA